MQGEISETKETRHTETGSLVAVYYGALYPSATLTSKLNTRFELLFRERGRQINRHHFPVLSASVAPDWTN